MRLTHSLLAAAALSLTGAGVQAQEEVPVPDARLSAAFRDPVGTVGPTDQIEMWVTLTSVGTDPVTFDENASEPFGLPEGFVLPTEGDVYSESGPPTPESFDSYSGIGRSIFRYSSGDSFSAGGALAPYRYDLPGNASGWLRMPGVFALNPGESIDVHLYTLTPVGGVAAAGTYEAHNVGLTLNLYGLAADGETEVSAELFSATTCNGQVMAGCGFTRTVSAVPEPQSLAMLLAGLGVLGAVVSRRRKAVPGKFAAHVSKPHVRVYVH